MEPLTAGRALPTLARAQCQLLDRHTKKLRRLCGHNGSSGLTITSLDVPMYGG